jgi:hypothetical protein
MRNISSVRMIGVISAALLLSLPLWARLQEKTAEKPAATPKEPRAIPGAAEMERLKFYVGEWDYTETYPKSAFSPNGGKNTGVYSSKLGPGGQSLVNSFHSQGPVGDFEGLIVMTWDAGKRHTKLTSLETEFPEPLWRPGSSRMTRWCTASSFRSKAGQ